MWLAKTIFICSFMCKFLFQWIVQFEYGHASLSKWLCFHFSRSLFWICSNGNSVLRFNISLTKIFFWCEWPHVRNLTSLELDMNSCQKGVVAIIFYSSKEVALLLIIVPMVCMVNQFMFNGSLCFCLLQFRLYEIFSMIILSINLMD